MELDALNRGPEATVLSWNLEVKGYGILRDRHVSDLNLVFPLRINQ
jgi:hypothetical protein